MTIGPRTAADDQCTRLARLRSRPVARPAPARGRAAFARAARLQIRAPAGAIRQIAHAHTCAWMVSPLACRDQLTPGAAVVRALALRDAAGRAPAGSHACLRARGRHGTDDPFNDRDVRFRDGLGIRVATTDASGDAVEQLRWSPELANQESAIRDRVGSARQLPPRQVRPPARRRSAEAGRQGAGGLVRRRRGRPPVGDSRGARRRCR